MLKLGDLRLNFKFTLAFLLVGLIPFGVIGTLAWVDASSALSLRAFDQLRGIRDIKKSYLENYLHESVQEISNYSQTIEVQSALERLIGYHAQNGSDANAEYLTQTDAYGVIKGIYDAKLARFIKAAGLKDLYLICTEHGHVMFSVDGKADLGTNLQTGPYRESGLAHVWRAVRERKEVVWQDFSSYGPADNAPVAFLGAPVLQGEALKGVLVVRISSKGINDIMRSRSGMGRTGDSYLVGPDNRMRSDSFLYTDHHTVAASFANTRLGRVDTEATKLALSGMTGQKLMVNHDGVAVLSAYTPVAFGEKTWALVTEINQEEAFGVVDEFGRRMVVIAVVGVIVITLLALFLSRSMTKPITSATQFAKQMAAGDLSQSISIKQQDEIGVMVGALNEMVANLGTMVRELTGGVNTLTDSSTQLTEISQQMSADTDDTYGKANAVATAAEQMSTSMTSVASATEQASANVSMVATAAEEMTATISEISENAEKARSITFKAVTEADGASRTVDDLGQAAKEIGKVTESISEISEQTNLLALNATIEAARAGDAGRGFAVVATEIKELAKQAAAATEEIKSKIEGIQTTTAGTVTRIGEISGVINQVNEIVATIATAVEEQAVTTKEIANNIAQAAQGIKEVTENVAQSSIVAGNIAADIAGVDQAARNISASSTQVNQSAEDLNQVAVSLQETAGRLKV